MLEGFFYAVHTTITDQDTWKKYCFSRPHPNNNNKKALITQGFVSGSRLELPTFGL